MLLGIRMRMIPCAVPLCMWVGHMEQLSEILHCWFSGSQKNNTWLLETLWYALSTFELFVLFLLSWLLRWTDFGFFFSLSELLVISCAQHSFLHLTLPNTYIVKGQPHCPFLPPSRNVVPPPPTTPSSVDALM